VICGFTEFIEQSVAPRLCKNRNAAHLQVHAKVTQLIVHFGFDNSELRAMTVDRPNPDSGWRQRDYNFFTSAGFQDLLQLNDIQLITWREIGQLLKKS
jgi:hypothetical protein